ncbi:MAG: GYD domain-containing protein [Rhodospirillaceae bacterium]|nr:GYD domain-containing protein [Rhodospirillaceae bacterium]
MGLPPRGRRAAGRDAGPGNGQGCGIGLSAPLWRRQHDRRIVWLAAQLTRRLTREVDISKYIVLLSWTTQGVQNIKDAPDRLDAGKIAAKALGGKIETFYLTMGGHDGVLIVDMPSDDAMAKFLLTVSQSGNIRTTTLKAFAESEYRQIIGNLGKSGGAKKKKKKKKK